MALRKPRELVVAGHVNRRAVLTGGNALHRDRDSSKRAGEKGDCYSGGKQAQKSRTNDAGDQQLAHDRFVLAELVRY